jgi:hypothetical protein
MARAAAQSRALPPPTGGWDVRNALADMPEENAVVLDNWFPSTDKVTLRRGAAEYADGMAGPVESLLEYIPATGAGELFAASDGGIYDVSGGGAVGAAEVSSLTNDRWQAAQITTAGGHFLIAMNGQDTPITYDGSTWGTTTVSASGLTPANLVWCNLHQRRLWFGEANSMDAWYLAVNSITGTPAKFPIGALAKRGGYIMAMGTWTRDGGDGADDVAVFLTSEGQAVVYSGTDPASASTWQLVGVFDIGKPIGRRCMIKAGADLIMVTQDGFVAASSILAADRSQAGRVAISAQIDKAVNDSVRSFGDTFGWQPFIYPKGTMLIFNVPQGATAHQYVFNTLTNAPCRFTGLDAVCWGMLNDNAYYGTSDGRVMLFDTGATDDGSNIAGDAVQAFNYLGSKTRDKSPKRVECLFTSDGNPNAAIDINIDFDIKATTAVPVASPSSGSRWGIARWGIGRWGSASQVYRGWRGVRGYGRAFSVRVRVNTGTARPSWVATNILFLPGGVV